jgi:hypothetical protein
MQNRRTDRFRAFTGRTLEALVPQFYEQIGMLWWRRRELMSGFLYVFFRISIIPQLRSGMMLIRCWRDWQRTKTVNRPFQGRE